jgi:putative membrane protein insertion efficiency factor
MLARSFIFFIRVYQWTLAPLFGNVCRFEPSCSRYAIECIRIHGALVGAWLGFRRVLRCHPFNPGGHDPPPPRREPLGDTVMLAASSTGAPSIDESGSHAVDCPRVY